jgi:hypothetical protein
MNTAMTAEPNAMPAETRKASVKPLSTATPATALAARIVADTCEPSDEPTDRTSALKPVASPVCCAGTASRIRFGIAAKANAMPADMSVAKAATSSWLLCSQASSASPVAVPKPPMARDTLLPNRLPIMPDTGPRTSIDREPGNSSKPARVASTPKP